jgi:hypothetical protein
MDHMRNRQTITRATAVAASAQIALGLAACSGSGSDGDAGASADESAPAESATEESPTEDAPAEDDAASGGDVCSAVQVLTETSSALGDVDPKNLDPTIDQLEELTGTLEGVSEPPAEIADDWETLTTAFRTATDALGKAVADPEAADAQTNIADAMTAMTDASFQEAGQAVGTYTAENC